MKVVAAILCLALGAAWARPARADAAAPEIRPDFNGLEVGRDAAETYRLNALGIVREEVSGRFPFIYVGRGNWWRPIRGKFHWATRYDDFFWKMGRDDLWNKHRRRGIAASTLYWGGVATTVAGLVVFLTGNHTTTREEVGLGMFAGGFAMTTVGSNIAPPLVSEEDALAMVNEYNRRLQVHLGLPIADGSDRERRPIGFRLSRSW